METAPGPRLYWISISCLILLPGLISGCSSRETKDDPAPAATVAVVSVARHNLATTLEIASEFTPYQEVDAYAKVSGYVQKLFVNWGSHVKQGEVLAQLEIPELEQQLHADEATVARSQHDLARAQEELQRVQSEYNLAHVTYTRIAGVQKTQPGLLSQEEVDEAEEKDQASNATVSAAKESLEASQQALATARAELDRDRAMYSYSRITAPFPAVVTELDAYKGALLPAGTSSDKGDLPLCHLSQNDLLRLVIPVPERAVPDVHAGEAVAVHVSTLGQTFQGRIARFSERIGTGTRTMYTEVDVPNPKYVLVPGMYANVDLPLQTANAALAVPVQAVQSTGEARGIVFAVNGENKLERREVTIGLKTSAEDEIVSGLRDGERVVFGDLSQHRPGEVISPKPIQPEQIEAAQAQ